MWMYANMLWKVLTLYRAWLERRYHQLLVFFQKAKGHIFMDNNDNNNDNDKY